MRDSTDHHVGLTSDRRGLRSPNGMLFVIGAMKSGTTSLFEILGQHPSICRSSIKEPNFFCEDRDEAELDSYTSLWNWEGGAYSYAMEASVAYSKAPNIPGVPERIYRFGASNNKFIYILRHPLSRIESQVRHGMFAGWGKSLDAGVPNDAINYSRYAMQIDEYLKFFPRENILILTLEEFKSDPHFVLKRICDFLCIDPDYDFSAVREIRNSGSFFNSSRPGSKYYTAFCRAVYCAEDTI